jgi:hypothetical protein
MWMKNVRNLTFGKTKRRQVYRIKLLILLVIKLR